MTSFGKNSWTPKEDETLRKLARSGATVANIADRLNRSAGSIRNRASRLKIALAKSRKLIHDRHFKARLIGELSGGLAGRWRIQQDVAGGERPLDVIMLNPTPEVPDELPISQVQFPTRILNVLAVAGLRTVGDVREASDKMLLSLPGLGHGSVAHLRETLGLPSCDGKRPSIGLEAEPK